MENCCISIPNTLEIGTVLQQANGTNHGYIWFLVRSSITMTTYHRLCITNFIWISTLSEIKFCTRHDSSAVVSSAKVYSIRKLKKILDFVKKLWLQNKQVWKWTYENPYCTGNVTFMGNMKIRADSRFAPSQWETSLQSNAVSHWLGANLESAMWNLTKVNIFRSQAIKWW